MFFPWKNITLTCDCPDEAAIPLTESLADRFSCFQFLFNKRSSFRILIVFSGMFLAKNRRTASSWFRSAGVRDDWDCFYDVLETVGQYLSQNLNFYELNNPNLYDCSMLI